MLEEAVRNEKSQPAETALSMLSFLQSEMPAGGTASESRFFGLFGPLCERIFGPVLGPEDGFRHKDGGWLSAQQQWTRPPSTLVSSPRSPLGQQIASKASLSRSNTMSLDSDPVVKLLGTAGKPNNREPLPLTLVEAISKESENRPSVGFAFKFHALPKHMQDAWLVLVEASMGGSITDDACSENNFRLLGSLLRKRPEEQNQLRLFKQRSAQKQQEHLRQPLQLSPRGFNSPTAVVTPMKGLPSPNKANEQAEATPNVMLSMLEYYLVLFLRFPVAAPDRKVSSVSSIPGVNVHRIATPTNAGMPMRVPRETFGEIIYYHIFRRCMRHFLPYEPEDGRSIAFTDEYRESELFLRMIIALWLESPTRLTPTTKVVQTILERRQRSGLDDTALASTLDLNSSYDLVQQASKYDPPPAQVCKCLRTLIIHAVLDPALTQNCLDHANAEKWCLSTCVTVLQQPFYNYVRTSFRYASIHSSDSPFYGALNSWLIWLEPWNVTQCTYCYTVPSLSMVYRRYNLTYFRFFQTSIRRQHERTSFRPPRTRRSASSWGLPRASTKTRPCRVHSPCRDTTRRASTLPRGSPILRPTCLCTPFPLPCFSDEPVNSIFRLASLIARWKSSSASFESLLQKLSMPSLVIWTAGRRLKYLPC